MVKSSPVLEERIRRTASQPCMIEEIAFTSPIDCPSLLVLGFVLFPYFQYSRHSLACVSSEEKKTVVTNIFMNILQKRDVDACFVLI